MRGVYLVLFLFLVSLIGCSDPSVQDGVEVLQDQIKEDAEKIPGEGSSDADSATEDYLEKYRDFDKSTYFSTTLTNYQEICSKITFSNSKEECFSNAAFLLKNASICDNLINERIGYEDCLATVAYATGDITICDLVDDRLIGGGCLTGVAISTGDVSLCQDVEASEQRDLCFSFVAEVTNDVSICDQIQIEDIRSPCYGHLAQVNNDVTYCDKIPEDDQLIQSYCKRAMLDKLFYTGECLLLRNNYERQYCFDIKAKTAELLQESTSKEICDSLPDSFDQQYDCYADIASSTGDVSLCDEFPPELSSERDFCLRAANLQMRDVSFCSSLKTSDQKDFCFMDASIYSKNVTVCERIDDTSIKNRCYQHVGVILNEPSICAKATKQIDEVKCLKHIAKATQDPSICEYIEASNVKGACYADLFQENDGWKYGCGWEPDWIVAYMCYFAKEEAIFDAINS